MVISNDSLIPGKPVHSHRNPKPRKEEQSSSQRRRTAYEVAN